MSSQESGEIYDPSNINLHPTPEKASNPYTLSNRKRSRMRSHNTKSPVKIRSRFESSPAPTSRLHRYRSRSPQASTSSKHNRRRSRSPRKHRSASPPDRSRKHSPSPSTKKSTLSYTNRQDSKSKYSDNRVQSDKIRGTNSSRIKGLELTSGFSSNLPFQQSDLPRTGNNIEVSTIEKDSIESIELPESLKVKVRAPKK